MLEQFDMQERRGQLEGLPTSDLLDLALHYDSRMEIQIDQFSAYHGRPNAGENDGSGYVVYDPPSLEDGQRVVQDAAEFEAVRAVLRERGVDINAAVAEHLADEEMEVRERAAYTTRYMPYSEQEAYVDGELKKVMPSRKNRVKEIMRKVFQ